MSHPIGKPSSDLPSGKSQVGPTLQHSLSSEPVSRRGGKSKLGSSLLWRLFFIYLLILFIGVMILTAKNVWVHSMSLTELAQFFFRMAAGIGLFIVVLLQVI